MLQGVEAERDHGRSVRHIGDSEYPAFFAQFVIVIGVGGQHADRGTFAGVGLCHAHIGRAGSLVSPCRHAIVTRCLRGAARAGRERRAKDVRSGWQRR